MAPTLPLLSVGESALPQNDDQVCCRHLGFVSTCSRQPITIIVQSETGFLCAKDGRLSIFYFIKLLLLG